MNWPPNRLPSDREWPYEDFTEADELDVRPRILDAIDTLSSAVDTGLRNPAHDQVSAHLREIERIIGRRP